MVEPWIQFIRNIPPLAYVFLIIAALGVGQVSKVTVIFIAAFLVMVITIYQGVKGVDTTLIKRPVYWAPSRRTFSSKLPSRPPLPSSWSQPGWACPPP